MDSQGDRIPTDDEQEDGLDDEEEEDSVWKVPGFLQKPRVRAAAGVLEACGWKVTCESGSRRSPYSKIAPLLRNTDIMKGITDD